MTNNLVNGKRCRSFSPFSIMFIMWRSMQILSSGGTKATTTTALAFQIPTCRRLTQRTATDYPRAKFLLKSSSFGSSMEQPSSEATTSSISSMDYEATEKLLEAFQNPSNRRDQVVSVIAKNGGIKVTACTARNLVNDMMMRHTLTEVPADALGRTAICALLMSNGIQNEQIVQISMNGDGPLRGVLATSNGLGQVRGYVGTPMLGKVLLQEAVGQKGAVQVVKNHPDWPRPYNGITAIRHGDIDRDVGIYLAQSEQRSCALAAATCVTGVLCKAAGGYLIEQLPGVDMDTVKRVEQNLAKLVEKDGGDNLPINLLLQGSTPLEICEMVLEGLDLQPLQQIEPTFACDCSEERLFRSLRLLPREEVDDILREQQQIEARCHFCGKVYRMSPEQVEERFAKAKGDPALDSDFNG